jgi:hypothetical protein
MASFFKVLFSGRRTTVLDAGELGPLMTNKRRDGAEPLPDPLPDIPQPDSDDNKEECKVYNLDHARRWAPFSQRHRSSGVA